MADTIVIYFSHSANDRTFQGPHINNKGNTQIAAEAIRDELSCDIFRVEMTDEYTEMAWYANREMLKKAMKGRGVDVKEFLHSIEEYTNVFLCTPCWWCSCPAAMMAQIKKLNFRRKNVMCLVTHEGINPEGCVTDMKKRCKGGQFGKSLMILGDEVYMSLMQIVRWAKLQVEE